MNTLSYLISLRCSKMNRIKIASKIAHFKFWFIFWEKGLWYDLRLITFYQLGSINYVE
jgi:hypothetical protein